MLVCLLGCVQIIHTTNQIIVAYDAGILNLPQVPISIE